MCSRVALLVMIGGCELVFPLETPIDGPPIDAPTEIDAAPLKCPTGYVVIAGAPTTSRYRKSLALFPDWFTSVADCLSDKQTTSPPTHLIVMSNLAEFDAIRTDFNNINFWIGFSDVKVDGTFQTVSTEQPNFPADNTAAAGSFPWAVSQPTDSPAPTCVIHAGQRLVAVVCGQMQEHICECDQFADAPGKH